MNICKASYIFGGILILLSCAGQMQTAPQQPPPEPAGPEKTQETGPPFNPLEYDEKETDISFVPVKKETSAIAKHLAEDQYVVINTDRTAWEEEQKRLRSLEEDEEHRLGFRIQIYTSTFIDSAIAMKDSLERTINALFYLEHDDPYYKIRLGNYTTRDEAENLREKIVGYGYKEAWIVRSEICYSCSKEAKDLEIIIDSTNADGEKEGKKE